MHYVAMAGVSLGGYALARVHAADSAFGGPAAGHAQWAISGLYVGGTGRELGHGDCCRAIE